jgi:hypothetical protein
VATGSPVQTKQAAASPFHGYFVPIDSKKAILLAFRALLTNGVSPTKFKRSVTAVTKKCGNLSSCIAIEFFVLEERIMARFRAYCEYMAIDKTRLPPDNRSFSSLQWKVYQ